MFQTSPPANVLLMIVGAFVALVITSCSSTTASRSIGVEQGPPVHSSKNDMSSAVPRMAVDPSPQHCTGRVGDVSVNGDVMVPAGAACQLIGTTVGGNVSVGPGARLFARSVDVDGDIEGERTGTVEVTEGSEVGGNIQLDSGGTVLVSGSHVDGDLAWEEQQGFLIARDNSVGGNVELDANTGGAELVGNTISGDLSCEANRPTPRGGHNRLSGDEDDQCHDL